MIIVLIFTMKCIGVSYSLYLKGQDVPIVIERESRDH
ncbi:MAG: hypothetical protein ACI86M_003183 [Saprospiraceae bacterium]|jgi:hypothetical protein